MHEGVTKEATHQKRLVALSSVLAAVFLTGFKLVVGLMTNSLGILSEAAHSALDLVAAAVTFLAVRISDRPPDKEHQFGHGKIESLAALVETVLLLVTCIWIIYEAFERLLFKEVHVSASAWAFIVMGTSIVVDMGRSRALARAARKYHSQALEADALHFQTDIWSSSVVIIGLVLIRLAGWLPQYRTGLVRADAVAALFVAGIVVYVSVKLGKRTVDAILDRAPVGSETRIREAITRVEHVRECSRLRLRISGPVTFVEATVRVAPDLPVGLAHEVATKIEESVVMVLPFADVLVHLEPTAAAEEDIPGRIRAFAAQLGLSVHDIHAHRLDDGYHVDLDLVVSENFSLEKSHDVATRFEETLRSQMENLASVVTHIEVPPAVSSAPGREITSSHEDLVEEVRAIAEAHENVAACHDVRVRQAGGDLYVSLHCVCSGSLAMGEAHRCSTEIESRLRIALPQVAHFLVHLEPS
jgi:cation diffusion facilitator family transporter